MEYRKIRADEMAAAGRIMAQAFHAQNFQESLNESGHDHEYFYGAVQEDGHMAATLCAPPHSVNYFGQYVPMAQSSRLLIGTTKPHGPQAGA